MKEKRRVIVSEDVGYVSSVDPVYALCLTSEQTYEPVIPKTFDVLGAGVKSLPPGCDALRLRIGTQTITQFDSSTLAELATFPIYITKCPYMHIYFEFVFDKEWLMEREEFVMVEEMSEDDSFIRLICDDVPGNPTGDMVREITQPVRVTIPQMEFYIEEGDPYAPDILTRVPFREKICLKVDDSEYRARLVSRCDLQMIDETIGVVTNHICYHHGTAGKMYSF